METYKTLEEICLANPLKVRLAKVQFEVTSDYDPIIGRRKAKEYVIYPLEMAVTMWKHPLAYMEKTEKQYLRTNKALLYKTAKHTVGHIPGDVLNLIPDAEDLILAALENKAMTEVSRGNETSFIKKEIEHQTVRILQVYIPSYHAEYAGKSIDVEAEVLWENPN